MRPVPLDSVLLSFKEKPEAKSVEVDNAPPVIFHSEKPASLVVFDGEPVLAPAGQSGLSFAVNTNWGVFTDGKEWYLLNNGTWFAAPAATGPYSPTTKLPPSFNAIPRDANFADVRGHLPPRAANPATAPAIFVSTKPAEIIVTAGPPQFAPVTGTTLQVARNTASTLFVDPARKQFYYLVSGRWFAAPGLDGPWVFATNDLPPDFALIQPDGPGGQVLASVPNTAPAQLAVLQAQVPQQATLRRDAAKLNVVYVGAPRFKPIPGTPIKYATNTLNEVLDVDGRYYACYQGAWFVAPAPTGPWVLADSAPPVIYTIPPSVPPYNVTYVTIPAATPAAVTFAYTAGYMMAYASSGVMVYGTGYYYPPVVVPGPMPAFLPYPYTYAGNVAYNPTTGAWTRGGTVYGPYGGAVRTANGDVYAGRDGNAYQHTSSGWSKWENGGWQPVQTPTASSGGQRAQSTARAPSTPTQPATLGGTQGARNRYQNHGGFASTGGSYAGRLDSASYQQLEQDRQARTFGAQRQSGAWRQAGGGGAGRGFGGGGRFRR